MNQLIFRNWKFAILWVIGTMASVGAFFADGGGQKKLEQAAVQVSKSQTTVAPAQSDSIDNEATDDGFTSDKELESQFHEESETEPMP